MLCVDRVAEHNIIISTCFRPFCLPSLSMSDAGRRPLVRLCVYPKAGETCFSHGGCRVQGWGLPCSAFFCCSRRRTVVNCTPKAAEACWYGCSKSRGLRSPKLLTPFSAGRFPFAGSSKSTFRRRYCRGVTYRFSTGCSLAEGTW